MPGGRLGHFEIRRPIGAGGMGLVFEARDLRLDRTVALKVLPHDLFVDEAARSRFRREAQLAASITHPNIAMIHEIDEEGETLFIAMELVPGANLKDLILEGPLAPERVVSLGVQACDALEAAHRQGVIHRDVKSSNIMITPEGRVKVLDFGLAKPLDPDEAGLVPQDRPGPLPTVSGPSSDETPVRGGRSGSTRTGVAVGTPPYMSPEQAEGRRVDERTDVFSLGVVLYEAASGQLPFNGSDAHEILKAIRVETPPALHELRPSVPPALSRTVSRCLEKNREERYPSVAALRRDLAGIHEGALARLRRAGFERVKARPSYAIAAAALLVFLAVLVGRGFDSGEPVPPEPPLLAVLPLVSLSGVEDEYIADGITEQLIARLSQLPSLRVISHRSVMPYKGSSTPLGEIAVAFGGVQWFLSGSVIAEGETVRVSVELMDDSLTNRLARVYERRLGNAMELQAELARQIVGVLQLQMTEQQWARLEQAPAVDDEAYRLYAKGREFWNRRTQEDYRTAIDYFRRALEFEPYFALAHAGLADAHVLLGPPSGPGRREAYRATKKATAAALAIDPELGEARAALAFAEYFLGWNWEAADEQFRLALALSPSYATAHHWYGDYLTAMNRIEEAIAEMEIARGLDPGSSAISRDRAWPLFMAGRWEDAAPLLEETLRIDPTFVPARTLLARSYARLGRHAEALALLQEIVLTFGSGWAEDMIAEVHAVGGRVEEAEAMLEVLIRDSREERWPYGIAVVYEALGRKEQALDWLWKSYEAGDRTLVNLNVDSRFDSLESEERFVELLRRMSFPRPRAGG